MLLFSFSPYSFAHVAAFFLALLFSSSCCYSPFRPATLFFALLSFPLRIAAFFWLFFYFTYKVLHSAILFFALFCVLHCVVVGVFFFVEESCITPLHSFLQKLGVAGSR